MKRFVWALAAAALCALAQPAAAQMADALGKPLPVSDLEAGTVIVRVVDGSPSKPLVGIDVELMVPGAGSARAARTDAEGRATFVKLAAGERFQARVTTMAGEEQKVTESEPFQVPGQGGLRIMLSTSPWQGGGGGGGEGMPAMPGMAGGMPDPRQMSGISRPQPGDPAGQLTIRVVRGAMSNNVPDHPVHLVGYGADGSITLITQRTDVAGRVVFQNLTSDRVAYYAMTDLPRQIGDRTVGDRVRSGVIMMPPEVGLRLLLAGEAPDSTAGPVEDMDRVTDQLRNAGPGEVVVQVFGQPENIPNVELMKLDAKGATSVTKSRLAAGGPTGVRGLVDEAAAQPTLAAGTVSVAVQRITRDATTPVAGVEVEIEPLTVDGAAAGEPVRQVTDAGGRATFAGLVSGAQVRVIGYVHGARVEGKPFTVPATGGQSVNVNVAWSDEGGAEARFRDVPAGPDAVYYARTEIGGKVFHTAPFLMAGDRGVTLRLLVFQTMKDPVTFSFHTQGIIDDVYMAFQTQLTITNFSYAPWDPGRDGLVIPLPAGFVGGQVDEGMTQRVGVDPDRGFLWRGAVPPGGAEFLGFFSLPISKGTLLFDLPLPHGSFNSFLALQHTPGMKVETPANVRGREWTDPSGRRHYVISNIQIRPEQRMVLTATGLPMQPAWQRQVSWAAGIVVIGLLVWGMSGVFRRRQGPAAQAGDDARDDQGRRRKLEKRRESLLEELVALETEKAALDEDEYEKRKSKLTRQLESIYHDLATERAGARART